MDSEGGIHVTSCREICTQDDRYRSSSTHPSDVVQCDVDVLEEVVDLPVGRLHPLTHPLDLAAAAEQHPPHNVHHLAFNSIESQ